MNVWQPIDTAPKDGTRVLLLFPNLVNKVHVGEYVVSEHTRNGQVAYHSERWLWGVFPSIGDQEPEPTHWMPLPEAPVVEEAA